VVISRLDILLARAEAYLNVHAQSVVLSMSTRLDQNALTQGDACKIVIHLGKI